MQIDDSLLMHIDNQLFRARLRIYNTGLSFLEKTLNVSQNNKCLYATHAKVLSFLILVLLCFLVVSINLRSLNINISYTIMVTKAFSSYIALCNSIVTICISMTSILTTQVLIKSGDTEANPGPKKSSVIKFSH